MRSKRYRLRLGTDIERHFRRMGCGTIPRRCPAYRRGQIGLASALQLPACAPANCWRNRHSRGAGWPSRRKTWRFSRRLGRHIPIRPRWVSGSHFAAADHGATTWPHRSSPDAGSTVGPLPFLPSRPATDSTWPRRTTSASSPGSWGSDCTGCHNVCRFPCVPHPRRTCRTAAR